MASRQQREREDERVEEARTDLVRLRVARMLQTWRVFAEEECSGRMREARATRHYHQQLLQCMLVAWKDRHVTMLKKKLLKVQSARFESCRLLSSCYIKWRQQVSMGMGVACSISDFLL